MKISLFNKENYSYELFITNTWEEILILLYRESYKI